MLFVPFAIFLLNNAFVHAEFYDKVYTDKTKCELAVQHAADDAIQTLPDGASVTVACLPLPSRATLPASKDPKPTPNQGSL